jgi:hypothetical protein
VDKDKELLASLKKAVKQNKGDMEYIHDALDEILCDELLKLGYAKAVEFFKKTPKWYA